MHSDTINKEMAQAAYNEFLENVKTCADKTVKNVGSRACNGNTLTYRKAVARRLAAGRRWRQALIKDRRDVLMRWRIYKRAAAAATGIRRQTMTARMQRWRQKVIETGGRGSRLLWSQFRGPKDEVGTVVADGRRFTSDVDILHQLYSHFSHLGSDDEVAVEGCTPDNNRQEQTQERVAAGWQSSDVKGVGLPSSNIVGNGSDVRGPHQIPTQSMKEIYYPDSLTLGTSTDSHGSQRGEEESQLLEPFSIQEIEHMMK